ncbi:DRTGG domain-containing protein [Anaeroselena agilis]|uniref:DRTGG domain-containing protein n=1 Tax=Anaeroselena agilis TaxID=3063788 RepID=A0ABU3NZV1_9FIRM|nr:DRTGG domain-containing protein [Selenomonadales bacterium 4137-cl]
MKLADVQKLLRAEVICCLEGLDGEVRSACGADLMSDVLVHSKEKTLLLTGLTNVQIIRTAEMGDLVGIVLVRGKRPGPEVIQMAESKGIPVMVTSLPMFESCGILYKNGIKGCSELVTACES